MLVSNGRSDQTTNAQPDHAHIDTRFTFIVDGVASTGYFLGYHNLSSFPDRVPTRFAPIPDLVVVFGSRNDFFQSESIYLLATRTYAEIKSAAPGAKILVIAPSWVNQNVPPLIFAIRDALKRAASNAGAQFLDPLAEQWFFGADGALIGTDRVHPTDAGHASMGKKIALEIESMVG